MTLILMDVIATIITNDSQHIEPRHKEKSAIIQSVIFFILIPSAAMLSAVILCAVILSAVILSAVILSAVILSAVILNAIIVSVAVLIVAILNVIMRESHFYCYAECHYVESLC